jgi:hypothetical protein
MAPETAVKFWFGIISGVGAVLAALWVYTRFVVERALLPPVEFTIDCNVLGEQSGKRLVEVLLHLKNAGSATLVATDITTRLRYITSGDPLDLLGDPTKSTFGRANFPHVQTQAMLGHDAYIPSVIHIVAHDTFVQPNIDQVYTLVTAVPASATFLLIWAQFRYAQHPSFIQLIVLKLSRLSGCPTITSAFRVE